MRIVINAATVDLACTNQILAARLIEPGALARVKEGHGVLLIDSVPGRPVIDRHLSERGHAKCTTEDRTDAGGDEGRAANDRCGDGDCDLFGQQGFHGIELGGGGGHDQFVAFGRKNIPFLDDKPVRAQAGTSHTKSIPKQFNEIGGKFAYAKFAFAFFESRCIILAAIWEKERISPKPSTLALRNRRQGLTQRLPPLTEVLRGSLMERYLTCGNPNCKCAKGERHGPVWYLSVTLDQSHRKGSTLSPDQVEQVRRWIANYHGSKSTWRKSPTLIGNYCGARRTRRKTEAAHGNSALRGRQKGTGGGPVILQP